MSWTTIIFHQELQDLLTHDHYQGYIKYRLIRRASVKDIIESLGPPHTEVGAIFANSQNQCLSYLVQPGDRLEIYPHTPPVDVTKNHLSRPALPEIAFVVDVNVGKIARLLRMLGFDTAYDWTWPDKTIARIAEQEKRIVLTRDRGLLKRKRIQWGRLLRTVTPTEQVKEVRSFFGLRPPYNLFSRCLRCNIPLIQVNKQEIIHRLEPKTKKYFHHFRMCPECKRIYWPGSHHKKMYKWIQELEYPHSNPDQDSCSKDPASQR